MADDHTEPGTQPYPGSEDDVQGEMSEIGSGPADQPQTRPMDTAAKQRMDKEAQQRRADAAQGEQQRKG